MKESHSVRLTALLFAAVLLMGAVPAIPSGLVAQLASSDAATAAGAALAIGRTRDPAGAALLAGHLRDPRDPVRALSIYGLGLIGLGSDAAPILQAAATDDSGAVRIAAIDALGRYEAARRLDSATEKDAALGLLALLNGGSDSAAIRGRAAIALSLFADSPEGDVLAQGLTDCFISEDDPSVRERIMWTIYRSYAKKVPIQLLGRGISDSDDVVRIEAARAYGKRRDPGVVDALGLLSDDSSWRVEEQAAESIHQIQTGKATEHWTSIPRSIHTPAPVPDPNSALPALPRVSVPPGPPQAAQVPAAPRLLPETAQDMLGPAPGPHPRVRIVTTQGNIYVALYPEWAPLTVANFLNMLNRGFLDKNPWFRIVPDFVVQTGEQDAVNQPGPGYTIPAELNPLEQNSYVISMGLDYDEKTNTPKLDSAGSEYYITLSPQYHLDNAFTVFGAVVGGFDVLGRLTEKDKVIRVERIVDVTL